MRWMWDDSADLRMEISNEAKIKWGLDALKGQENISAHVCDAGFSAVTKVPKDKISNVNTHTCTICGMW